jgi:hypothetical protein
MNIIVSLLLLGASLLGFVLLDIFKAALWLLFLIIAYPPALAVTSADPLPSGDVVELYRIGVSKIPVIGKILTPLFSSVKLDQPQIENAAKPKAKPLKKKDPGSQK